MMLRQFSSVSSRRWTPSFLSSPAAAVVPRQSTGSKINILHCNVRLQKSSFHHKRCNSYVNTTIYNPRYAMKYKPIYHNPNVHVKRWLTSPPPSKTSAASHVKGKGAKRDGNQSNSSTKYFTTKTSQDAQPPPPPPPPEVTSVEAELAQLRAEISQLSYLIKQTSSQQIETQTLSRRAEARAYIIENKLIEINKHVVKIPASLENATNNVRTYLKDFFAPAYQRVNESGASFLTSKYTVWVLFGGFILFWQYRLTMYQRTSEEVAEVAALTLQQDSLRTTIQETLTTVANSPETLASLSALFQKLISEERTEQHLINLIVRALNSEGVRDAAVRLLDVCFQNPELQARAGEFLKVAANAAVLDRDVQKNAGMGIQQALKSAVLPWWAQQSDLGYKHGKDIGAEINSNNGSPPPTTDAGSSDKDDADKQSSSNEPESES